MQNAVATNPVSRIRYIITVIPILALEYGLALFGRSQLIGAKSVVFREMNPLSTKLLYFLISLMIFGCVAWIGWLSARRSRTIRSDTVFASFAVVPWLQLLVIPILAFAKEQSKSDKEESTLIPLRGALWGLGIALAAEVVFTLLLGDFGIALFVGSPFVVGLVTAYFSIREGHSHPIWAGQLALLLASLVLFGFAYEGLFCLILAYPLAAIAAMVGGGIGIALARMQASRTTALSSVAILPLLLMLEVTVPPNLEFTDVHSIDVDAPPAAVWGSIVHMGRIMDQPSAPFGWGLAYPIDGRIDGQGIGAVRMGVFSTGIAYERVTRWESERELWFDVLTDPPMMQETNPFGPVNSEHLVGYFATRDARFSLRPLANGYTRLTLVTDHRLSIGPSSYFAPLARWAVSANKQRVLNHFRNQAEQSKR